MNENLRYKSLRNRADVFDDGLHNDKQQHKVDEYVGYAIVFFATTISMLVLCLDNLKLTPTIL